MKEEAERIIEMFLPYANDDYYNSIDNAKQCALIYCDGIIKAFQEADEFNENGSYAIIEYWQQLKQQLNKK